ncbi:serine hydrolase domain-containing protein [Gracilimonas tropica]|uniref:serine hydrolase domain-containing protein n=1 Tax=Gracilimonas tropica TaxID=454600 RepID=UPI00036D2926|nr:serine hydrolase domain-containing protein [Gracilimonas tropica]
MKKYVLLILVALFSLSCQTNEQDISSIENDLLPTFYIQGEKPEPASLADRMEHYNVPGLSVAVFRNGTFGWAKGYGMADKASNTPVTAQTLFQAASISKPIAAMAALDMAEDGIIDLDADINEYLSSWKLKDNEFTTDEKVTLRRILNHTAGTTVWGFPGYERTDNIPNAVGVVSGQGNTDSVFVYKVPGVSWQYSGGGYTVMQIALSDAAQKPFEEIMAERVLEPLSMHSSTYAQPLPDQLHDRAASGYRSDSSEIEGKWHVYPEQAAAGLWTNPTDIGRYAIAVQQALEGSNEEVLNSATVQEMLTPGDNNYGLGLGIRYDGSHFGHSGSNAGFRSDFAASKKGGNVVVIMTNSDSGSPLIAELMQAIFRHYGWPQLQPTVKEKAALSEETLRSFVGKYQIAELGEISIVFRDSGLVVPKENFIQTEIDLVPENDSTLFDASDGTPFHFTFRDGLPVGFEVQGLTGTRIEP